MAPTPGFLMTETGWRTAIISSSLAVIALSVWCLLQGITTIFMHLYYIPLVLIAYHYRKRGLILCALLCLLYLALVIIFDPNNPTSLEGAFIRVLVFVAISVLVAFLAETLVAARDRLASVADIQQGIVQNANVWLMVLDKAGRILEWNRAAEVISGYPADEVMGKNTIWKQIYPDAEFRKEITGKIAEIITQNKYLENLTTTITAKDGKEKIILWNTRELPGSTGESPRYIAIGIDITERTSAEKAVRASEAKILLLLNSAAEAIYGLDMQGNCTFCNNACLRVLGYHHQDELLGKNMHRQIHAKHADGSTFPVEECRIFQAFQKGEGTHVDDEVLWRADGTSFPAEYWSYPQRYEGNIVGAVVTFMDITDRKRMENALRTSEAKFRSLFENLLEGMAYCRMIYDDQGRPVDWVYLTVNRSFERLTGLVGVEGKRVLEVIPDIRTLNPGIFDTYGRVAETGNPEMFEIDFKPLRRWMRISAFCPEKGYFVAVFDDITEHKHTEDDVRTARDFYLRILDDFPNPVWRADVHGKCDYFNKDWLAFTGRTLEQELGDGWAEGVHPDDLERCLKIYLEHFNARAPFEMEYRLRYHDGTYRWLSDSGKPLFTPNGDFLGYIGSCYDLHDRKQAEDALRESEERFRQFFNNINESLYLHAIGEQGLPGKFIDVNDVMCERLGYRRDELLLLAPQDIVSDAGRAKMPAIAEEIAGKGHATFETEHRKRDGSIIPVEVSTVIFSLAGTRVAMASARDITERKRAEEAIAQSEERYRTLAEASPDQIFINDRNGTILYTNTTGLKLFGLPYDQVVGKQTTDLFPPEMLREQADVFEKVFDSGEPVRQEAKIRFGELEQWLDMNLVPLKDAAGKVTAVLGVARDITLRRKMEEALRESRQLFSDIISFLPDPTYVIDREGQVIAWNRALEELSGIPAGVMLGKGDFEYSIWQYEKRRPVLINLVQDPDQDAARMNYLNIRYDGSSVMAETTVTLQSGRTVTLSLVASPLYDAKGSVTGAIESMRDITQIKETEAELARLNENLENIVRERTRALQEEVAQRIRAETDVQAALDYTRSVIEANPDLMVVLDTEGKILDVNTIGETLTGIPKDQLIGTPYFGYLEDDGMMHTAFYQHLETGWTDKTIRIRRTDGHFTPLSVHATMITGTGTTPDRIIVAAHDITRQKQDEDAIRVSLDEKVLLLREIHHRVKNNLQIIISLTNLQMRTIENPEMKQILAETRNRVRAMSLVHERLYMSENLSSIDLADYTKFLATQLFSFYGVDHLKVALQTDIEKILLDIDTAIPLGLILNELISNALKHAFPHDGKGTLSISGHVDRDMLTLTVKDDGVGMPEDYNWKESDSLGLRLINSLVDQVGGTIEKEPGVGTMFIITLHRKTNRESGT